MASRLLSLLFFLSALSGQAQIVKVIAPLPIKCMEVDEVFCTYDIQFEYNKAVIRPQSYGFLDSMVSYFMKCPNLIVEVGGHTDTRGSQMYSRRLSAVRAKAVVVYFVEKGLPQDRFINIGYEGSKPLISEESIEEFPTKEEQEFAHSVNRRMEFIVLKTDYNTQGN